MLAVPDVGRIELLRSPAPPPPTAPYPHHSAKHPLHHQSASSPRLCACLIAGRNPTCPARDAGQVIAVKWHSTDNKGRLPRISHAPCLSAVSVQRHIPCLTGVCVCVVWGCVGGGAQTVVEDIDARLDGASSSCITCGPRLKRATCQRARP